jgi:hypothetical protein
LWLILAGLIAFLGLLSAALWLIGRRYGRKEATVKAQQP